MSTEAYIKSLNFNANHEDCGEDSPVALGSTPKLVADREVDTRIERLNQTWGYANATVRSLSHKYQRLWSGAVVELADRKGTLCVTWRDELSRAMFEGVILGAWEANGEHMHSHSLS